ncbi:hypothetical protein [Erwinia sp. CGal63]|uniref:hypothetical protein n=1 Tax=Erwinia sp. CGal63 TaxID=2919889 RepID=UPI003007FEB3
MPKSIKVTMALIGFIVVGFMYALPYIKMEFAGSAHYTERDKREYNFYTPEILKKMPRISSRYAFEFANVTGPSRHVYVIKFYDTEDTSKIDEFLSSVGYKRQAACNIDNVCWRGTDRAETIMVRSLKSETGIAVQVVYDFT